MASGFDFVKVHAGWDECIFIYGDQLPKGGELTLGLSFLRRPSIRATEVGILYPSETEGRVRVRMIDDTKKDFIGMCGGLTQSLGKAIVETDIGERLGIRIMDGTNSVTLETDAELIPIKIDVSDGVVRSVTTDMQSYVDGCYQRGVSLVEVDGMTLVNVGIDGQEKEFLVLDVDELLRRFPQVDFMTKDRAALDALETVYAAFADSLGMPLDYLYGVVYKVEEAGTAIRICTVFRFVPWDFQRGDRLEYACGTGTTALGIALYKRGQIAFADEPVEVLLTVGGEHLPEETRMKTRLTLTGTQNRVVGAWFSHDRIELVASGKLYSLSRQLKRS